MTGERPSAWEARLLRRLSAAYVAERASDDPARPMPWREGREAAETRAQVDRQVRAMFGFRKTKAG